MNTSTTRESYQLFLKSVPPFSDIMTQDALYELLKRLDNPQDKLQVIHIAGTNGKGSSVALLEQLLQHSGFSVATYTSPYIHDIRECLHHNKAIISKSFMNQVTAQVKEAYISMQEDHLALPTHYECITAVAYLAMAIWEVDYCIVEVLMGGKNDATNVLTSVVAALITSISYDHTQYLGHTLGEIASHKAGIIKPNCPVFVNKNSKTVIDTCREKATAVHASIHLSHDYLHMDTPWTTPDMHQFVHALPLKGKHQIDNLEGALSVFHSILEHNRLSMRSEAICKALKTLSLPCRMEEIKDAQGYRYLLDGGHNAAGLTALYELLISHYENVPIHLIFSTLSDKENIPEMNTLIHYADTTYFCSVPNSRSLTAQELLNRTMPELKDRCRLCDTLEDAYRIEKTTHQQFPNCLTVVCGSFYLAYPMRSLIND